jgi:hypothetical protein
MQTSLIVFNLKLYFINKRNWRFIMLALYSNERLSQLQPIGKKKKKILFEMTKPPVGSENLRSWVSTSL